MTSQRGDKLRVLYVARAPFVSGAERALMTMLRHLDRERVEPMVVLGCESDLIEQARGLSIPVEVVSLPRRTVKEAWGYWRSVGRLGRVIGRFRPDVLHANDVPSCQAVSELGARLNLPRVVHVRWQISAAEAGWWARRGAERLICISRWMVEELGKAAGTTLEGCEVELLADAVDWPAGGVVEQRRSGLSLTDSRLSDPSVRPRPDLREDRVGSTGGRAASATREGVGEGVRLGFVGQVTPSKGLDLVIEAMGRVSEGERPGLVVAGKDTQSGGAHRAELEALAQRVGVADRVKWLGFLDDVGELYRQVDAVVCPSRIEPLGLVPLEAAAWSLPAAANRVGGLAETIVDGQTGWLVEPTVDGWAEVLPKLADAAARRPMGAAAHERVRREYAPAVYQARLMGMYEGLMRAKGA